MLSTLEKYLIVALGVLLLVASLGLWYEHHQAVKAQNQLQTYILQDNTKTFQAQIQTDQSKISALAVELQTQQKLAADSAARAAKFAGDNAALAQRLQESLTNDKDYQTWRALCLPAGLLADYSMQPVAGSVCDGHADQKPSSAH
jgi:hypothetical protein